MVASLVLYATETYFYASFIIYKPSMFILLRARIVCSLLVKFPFLSRRALLGLSFIPIADLSRSSSSSSF